MISTLLMRKHLKAYRSFVPFPLWSALVAGLTILPPLEAQRAPDVPLISGGIGMFSSTNEGFTFLQPVAAPVLAFPLGQHLLVESRADLRGFYQQNNETGRSTAASRPRSNIFRRTIL